MDSAIEMVEKGRVGMVALLGMGGVFAALFFLYFFTSVLGRLAHMRRSSRHAGKRISNPGPSTRVPTPTPDEQDRAPAEDLAAAIAVAYALGIEIQQTEIPRLPASDARNENSWKMAGRLALMQSWHRSASDRQRRSNPPG